MRAAIAKVKESIYQTTKEVIDLLGGIEEYVSAKERVLIKPNLCTKRRSDSGATTDKRVIEALVKIVKEVGANPALMESAIYPNDTEEIFDFLGYKSLGVPIFNVDKVEWREVKIPNYDKLSHIGLPKEFFQYDKIINVPKLKTHIQTTVSLGMKNLKGFIPGKQKHLTHLVGLDSAIVDLNKLIKSDLIVVDGIVGMEGMMGPTWGSPVKLGLMIAGDNVVATDAVCCRLMGINPKEVKHLALASRVGLGPIDLNKIELFGEPIDKVSRKFAYPKHSTLYSKVGNGILRGMHLIRNPIARLIGRQTVTKKIPRKEIRVDLNKCNLCELCQKACPKGAIKVTDRVLIDKSECILCCCCIEACNQGAISIHKI
jgi:uncharacterized protein (DUF362 family)/Pyruvate/2-oxoacid:ferredoxin oxidoreductase delta subunit